MINVGVFTGTRAEYGLMKHLIQGINNDEKLKLQLIVSGTHLSKLHGETINEILQDGIKPQALIPLSLDKIPSNTMARLTGEVIIGLEKYIKDLKPNLVFLLGDRYETFAAAATLHLMNVPIAHIHGGETTLGAVDDKLRHAITQLSTWHFTAAKEYKEKVIEMGVPQNMVFQIGPMIIDGIKKNKTLSKSNFEILTGYKFGKKNILVTYHPETLSEDYGLSGFIALLNAIKEIECNVLFTSPNADEGGENLLIKLKGFILEDPKKYFHISSLGQMKYINALKLFDAVVGNSSSGIIEAPFIDIPVLNIGNRQAGRLRFGSVRDVTTDKEEIRKGLYKILSNNNYILRNINKIDSLDSPSYKILDWLKKSFLSC